jgi:hypothetical protein
MGYRLPAYYERLILYMDTPRGAPMMRLAVRVALGLIVTLSTSSQASAQFGPGAIEMPRQSPRDPLLSRPFQGLTFDGKPAAVGSVGRPINATDILLAPHGGRLPEITAAPQVHGTPIPCTMRVVRVAPGFNSNMPVVSVEERVDPKSVIKVVCLPRE